LAATQMTLGTDVNFGELTEQMINYLSGTNAEVWYEHEVTDIERNEYGPWKIEIRDLKEGIEKTCLADFVFVGAGGGALKLLNKSSIDEIDGYGGFPVGGKWLKCVNPQIASMHFAKVYGKAAIGAPPMSVPHLDTRIIDGKREMLFGPYAGFSTKFLKHGSYWDLAASLDIKNMLPMIQVGIHNIPLTKYLVEQVRMSFEEKLDELKKFYPTANPYDWELIEAGQRVQVIKKNEEGEGILEFGTELIHSKDGSIAGLLGASPGASTATSIMLNLLDKCFSNELQNAGWMESIRKMIPGYKLALNENPGLLKKIRSNTSSRLDL
jgi:malate dehydrogenase (quinone)